MSWSVMVTVISIFASGHSINRPVYKIVLTQKGFSQFIQYDIDTPPIREFTFCTWIRLYELENEQGLFSYVVNGNRVIRLWLDSGGHFIKVSINEKTPSIISVDIVRDTWRHICLSYQSDYGAWALYFDGRLVNCETMQSLYDFVLPGGGSVIIGYGSSNVIPSGLEGEVFGANMLLSSTIERNHTLKKDPLYEQKRFVQNRVIGNRNLKYIVLGELDSKVIKNNFETSAKPTVTKKPQYFLKLSFPFSFSEQKNHPETSSSHPKLLYRQNEQSTLDFSVADYTGTTDKSKINFWSLVHTEESKTKVKSKITTVNLSTIGSNTKITSIWSTASPSERKNIYARPLKHKNPKENLDQLDESFNYDNFNLSKSKKIGSDEIASTTSVNFLNDYSQWTSSKLAGSVLNYLKSINFYNKEPIKMQINKPLVKISENFQNPKDFKTTKVHFPLKFQRKNFEEKRFDKREVLKNVYNQNSTKGCFHNQHESTDLIQGDVILKNFTMIFTPPRCKRQIMNEVTDYQMSEDTEKHLLRPLTSFIGKLPKYPLNSEETKKNNILKILPFIKSMDYFGDDLNNSSDEIFNPGLNTSDIFTRSLTQGNKWHNVQTFNNDFTPHRVNMDSGTIQKNTDISEANKKLPSVRLKYKHDFRKLLISPKDVSLSQGRALAKEVSNQSNRNDSFSILKYNRGYLPKRKFNHKHSDKINRSKKKLKHSLPNTLGIINKDMHPEDSLRDLSTVNKEDNSKNLYDTGHLDNKIENYKVNNKVSPQPGPKVCTRIETKDHVLYVQPDGSVDLTRIVSPVKDKNIGIEFITQNYKRCSLQDSILEKNSLLFIDWNKTPVRLFGGAYPKKTTDLCGFF